MSTTVEFKFDMCDIVKDKITGVKGTITDMYYYFTGCHHYGIVPLKLDSNGAIGKSLNLEEGRLVLISHGKKDTGPKRSGPIQNAQTNKSTERNM